MLGNTDRIYRCSPSYYCRVRLSDRVIQPAGPRSTKRRNCPCQVVSRWTIDAQPALTPTCIPSSSLEYKSSTREHTKAHGSSLTITCAATPRSPPGIILYSTAQGLSTTDHDPPTPPPPPPPPRPPLHTPRLGAIRQLFPRRLSFRTRTRGTGARAGRAGWAEEGV
jgi:hypothetical protein